MSVNLQLINQLFEIQRKIAGLNLSVGFERNFNRLFSILQDEGYIIQDPTNEQYAESRTDCEASIIGQASSKMKITKTLKPVIYHKENGQVQLMQKAVVLVEKI
jgi:hypothetical protein